MHAETDPDRDRDLEKDRERRLGELHENAGDHPAEDGQHDPEGEQQQHEKQEPHAGIEQPASHLANRHAPVAEADDEGCHIVHGPNEDRAHEHPHDSGPPAPHDRQGRPHDRPGAGDAREVVAEHDCRRRRDVVDVVPQFDARHDGARRELEHRPGQPATIREVGPDEQGGRAEDE